MQRSDIDVHGNRLSCLHAGEGPAVVLCHGFPETAYAWRHQIAALAAAGYRAIAPDLRGYGDSFQPLDAADYTLFDVAGDIVGLLDALPIDRAVVVGNDWGATLAWQLAQLRPDRVAGVAAFGVPMMGRAPMPPTGLFPQSADTLFYTLYFQVPGVAEREFEADVRTTLTKLYANAAGEAGPRAPDDGTPNPFGMVSRADGLLAGLPLPASLPGWLTEADLDAYVASYETSGFRGGLNWYRNLDRNWALQAALDGVKVTVPALYAVGARDTGLSMPGMDAIIAAMPTLVPDLRGSHMVPDAGHWLPQERPDAVNALLLPFIRRLFA
jgi:pimeloyl-ACP methyl ester carboxylesterase